MRNLPRHSQALLTAVWLLLCTIHLLTAGPALYAQAPAPVTDSMLRAAGAAAEWLTHGRSYDNTRYAPHAQIKRSNVSRLVPVWVHQWRSRTLGQESNPIVAGGVVYYTAPNNLLLAVDARTGRELWQYEHKVGRWYGCCGPSNRGPAVYGDKVYMATIDARLVAVDRTTGALAWETEIASADSGYSETMAPVAVEGKIIVGVSGSEFPIRGFVDAYDAETGARVWRFWTIPSPEEGGWWGAWRETTPEGDSLHRDIARERADSARYAESWRRGGGAMWNTPAYDPELGLLYMGIANPAPQIDGSTRPGDNLYNNCILALEAATGRLRWYYQTVPHDVWDYDNVNPVVLFDLVEGRERVPALGQAGKTGWVYVLDRRTGERIRRSEPFVPHENTFALPTTAGTRALPSGVGGANWMPSLYDPKSRLMFVEGLHLPVQFQLQPLVEQVGAQWKGGDFLPIEGEDAYLNLSAVDVTTGKVRWQRRVDSLSETAGGSTGVVTAGGLIFLGTGTGALQARDVRTGELLWSFATGGTSSGPPVSYMVDDRQYVTVPSGAGLFAFALPR